MEDSTRYRTMDKNLVLAVSLSLLVYLVWFGVVEKRYKNVPAPTGSTTPASAGTPRTPTPLLSPNATPAPGSTAPEPAPGLAAPRPVQQKVSREKLIAESTMLGNPPAKFYVHPRGAGIVSCLYEGPLGDIELVEEPWPGLFSTFPNLSFTPQRKGDGSVDFTALRQDGVEVTKTFLPGRDTNLPRLRITLTNTTDQPLATGAWTLTIGPGLGTTETEQKENKKVWRAIGLTPAKKGSRGKIEEFDPGRQKGVYRWVAVDNRYFLAAALIKEPDFPSLVVSDPPLLVLTAVNRSLAPGASSTWEIPYYLGAKGQTWLTRYGAGLERSIDFGFFAQLGRFVLRVLSFLNTKTHNWGWAIIILTFLMQIVLFPLSYKSLKATAAMKRLQPQIAKLQQRYSKDPQRLQKEMMDLYKKSGANPLGGCLPMLLQMPIFIALFNTLRNAWELHGSGWIFWITDLSTKDPYYVLPLVMGGLMFFQNKLNPAATDPTQAKMMTWMPVIFTFMFLNFPSGLVLYWLTNSIISTIQQIALRKHFERA